jgi:hypothetical protein
LRSAGAGSLLGNAGEHGFEHYVEYDGAAE